MDDLNIYLVTNNTRTKRKISHLVVKVIYRLGVLLTCHRQQRTKRIENYRDSVSIQDHSKNACVINKLFLELTYKLARNRYQTCRNSVEIFPRLANRFR